LLPQSDRTGTTPQANLARLGRRRNQFNLRIMPKLTSGGGIGGFYEFYVSSAAAVR
jgi:hypothetical protein